MHVAKGLKLKVKKFWGLTPPFAEVTGEKLVGKGLFASPPLSSNELHVPEVTACM